MLFGAARQTVKGVQAVRNELKGMISAPDDNNEKQMAEKILQMIDINLQSCQDENTKKWISSQKKAQCIFPLLDLLLQCRDVGPH